MAERPAKLWDLELRVSAEMSDGSLVTRGVKIDGPTGEIQPIEVDAEDKPALFQDQLRRSLSDIGRGYSDNTIQVRESKS